MSYVPEPWKIGTDYLELAEDISFMNSLNPPHETEGTKQTSLFRRYWDKLLQSSR